MTTPWHCNILIFWHRNPRCNILTSLHGSSIKFEGTEFNGLGDEAHDTQPLACQLGDIDLLFACVDDPLVLWVLFIFGN